MNAAIDLIKALAILLVLWQHTVPRDVTDDLFGNVWVRPAVPVFIVLLGYNLMSGARRRGAVRLRTPDLGVYLRRRAGRIALPFIPVLAIGYVVALGRGTFETSSSLAVGGLPVNAPGNYFIPALVGLVVLFPFLAAAYERAPRVTVAGGLAVAAAFEFGLIGLLGKDHSIVQSLLFTGNPLRWLGPFVLGMWLADGATLASRRVRVVLVPLAALSLAFLVHEQIDPGAYDALPEHFVRTTSVLAAPWAALLVVVGLAVLPERAENAPVRLLALLGAASYHVYLVQMLVIGVVVGGAAGFVLSIALGIAYFWVLPPSLGGAGEGADWARRPWATSRPSTSSAG